MIIDAHTHTFPQSIAPKVIPALQAKACSRAYTDGTDPALRASMAESDIACSVLLPVMTNPAQVEKLNSLAIQKNETASQTGLFSLGGMHPDYSPFTKELSRIAQAGITGIKLHPAYQGVDLDDVRFLKIIDEAAALGLAVVIHAGLDIGIMHHNFADVDMIETVLKEICPPKFVLAHMGGWKDWDTVEKELCGEPVFFDTSFSTGSYVPPEGYSLPTQKTKLLSKEQFERMVKKHGSDRILFGSDSPWSEQKQSVEQIRSCCFTKEESENIFFKNALKVFGEGLLPAL